MKEVARWGPLDASVALAGGEGPTEASVALASGEGPTARRPARRFLFQLFPASTRGCNWTFEHYMCKMKCVFCIYSIQQIKKAKSSLLPRERGIRL